jgi:hypothetical protein
LFPRFLVVTAFFELLATATRTWIISTDFDHQLSDHIEMKHIPAIY